VKFKTKEGCLRQKFKSFNDYVSFRTGTTIKIALLRALTEERRQYARKIRVSSLE